MGPNLTFYDSIEFEFAIDSNQENRTWFRWTVNKHIELN